MNKHDLENIISKYINRSKTYTEEISEILAKRLAVTFGIEDKKFYKNSVLPKAWHAYMFRPLEATNRLSNDGQPKGNQFLPDLPLKKFMLANREYDFKSNLYIGGNAKIISKIESASVKEGKSGLLVFLGILHEIYSNNSLCIIEKETFVYKNDSKNQSQKNHDEFIIPRDAIFRDFTPTNQFLFRYSAITFNTHRIHYDYNFATKIEKYPDLIVNGGIIGILIANIINKNCNFSISKLRIKYTLPLFVNRKIKIIIHDKEENDNAVNFHVSILNDENLISAKAKVVCNKE